jgi:signal peptidase
MILVKHTNANKIQIGDDITYLMDATNTITHRVVEIIENYNDSGDRGFQTQGVNNASPDPGYVYAANVVGVVVLHVPTLGAALTYLGGHIYIVFIMFGLLLGLSFALSKLFAKPAPASQNG